MNICQYCNNLFIGTTCNKCGAEYRLVAIKTPNVTGEALEALKPKHERETYDAKGNRVSL